MRFFSRRRTDDPRVEAALRASLDRHARQAPSGEPLAERIVGAVDRPWHEPAPSRSPWRTWGLPLVAAGSVAAVVGAVVGLQDLGHSSASKPPALSSGTPQVSSTPSVVLTTPAPSTSAPSTSVTSTVPVNSSDLHNVRIEDLTFAGTDDGWALGTADCTPGSGLTGTCTALLRTHDGKKWTSMPGADFNVPGVSAGCATDCVQNLRFATDQIGYAFGPSALYMTKDGGLSWTKERGGALFLETLNGNVIRVTTTGSGCPAECFGAVETAAIGSDVWTTRDLGPKTGGNFGFVLARGGDDAYLMFLGHAAGGEPSANASLFRSSDDGQSWTGVGEPCPQLGGEVDGTAIAAGAQGRVSVLCRARQAPNRTFVATSVDHGATFAAQPGAIPAAHDEQPNDLVGDPATVLVTAGELDDASGAYRSTDGGRSWQRIPQLADSLAFLGFESNRVGRAVTLNGRIIWTTRDGGATWSAVRLP